jgi:hypothetical protein
MDNTPIQGHHPTRIDTLCTRQRPTYNTATYHHTFPLPTTHCMHHPVTSPFLPDDPHTPVCVNEMSVELSTCLQAATCTGHTRPGLSVMHSGLWPRGKQQETLW